MPYAVEKTSAGDFEVRNVETGKAHAKHTTRAKAEAQVRLLRGIEHGMVPMGQREPVESRAVDKGHFQSGEVHPDMRGSKKYGGSLRSGDVPSAASHTKQRRMRDKGAPVPVDTRGPK